MLTVNFGLSRNFRDEKYDIMRSGSFFHLLPLSRISMTSMIPILLPENVSLIPQQVVVDETLSVSLR